jgi:hypothetical protein
MAQATKNISFLAQATNSKKLRRDKSGLRRFWLVAIFLPGPGRYEKDEVVLYV